MCFVHEDYEWIANVNEEADSTATVPTKCGECSARINIGDFVHTVHQEEAEYCLACENGDCECTGDCCECESPDKGETFDFVRCESCDKFLKAVEAAEVENGCSIDTARPGMPMWDDIQGGGRDEAKKYWQKAASMFPELVRSGYLGMIWRRAFG